MATPASAPSFSTDAPKRYALLADVPQRRARLLWVTLQGLVNREGPELYYVSDADFDEHWVEWYRGYGLEPDRLSQEEVLARFLPQVKGAYVLDEEQADWQVPLGVTMAGLDDRVLVTAEQADAVAAQGVEVQPLPVPRFHSRFEAMVWAVEHLRPRTNPNLLHANFWIPRTDNLDICDWVVAERGFSYRLTTVPHKQPGERELIERIFDATPPFSWVLGWHNKGEVECSYIDLPSRYALVPFCTTRNLNFTFHRHVPAKGDNPWKQPPAPQAPELDPEKCYVTIVFSDGDAPHSMIDLQKKQWNRPERGSFPFGWAIPPEMLKFGPAMLEYYYQTCTPNDELLCGPSGIGYCYLSHWGESRSDTADTTELRNEFYRRSNDMMKELDLRAMWPINRIVEWLPDGRMLRRIGGKDVWAINADNEPDTYGVDFMDDRVIHEYCTQVPQARGFFQGWHNVPHEVERVMNDRPYFPGKVLAAKPDRALRDIDRVAGGERRPGRPVFLPVHINCYPMDLAKVKEIHDGLDPERYEVLTPSAFLELALKASQPR
ncbi:MAG: GxGYxYP domain-containing protein [Phycisphaeraceae bacterium]